MLNRSAHEVPTTALSPHLSSEGSGESLEQILAQLPDAVMCINRDWQITFMNAEAMRLGRQTAESFRQGTFWQQYPELEGSPQADLYRHSMATGEPLHHDYFYPPFEIWLDLHVLPIRDGIALHYRDITSTKLAEAARAAMQAQLQQVLETTTDCVCALDRNWNFTFLNRRGEALLGRNDLLGKDIWQAFPATEEDTASSIVYHRAMDEGLPGEFEAFYAEPLNRWLNVICRPNPEGMVIFFRDITQERLDREMVERENTLLLETQQVARVATWEMDLQTGLLTHSPASYPVHGRPLALLRDLDDLRALLHAPHLPRLNSAIALATRTDASVTVEFQTRREDGTLTWLESRIRAVKRHGRPTHLRGLTIDINARKAADERREAAIRQLDGAMRATSEGVLLIDRNWTLTYLNPRAQNMMIPPGDYTGKNFWEVFPAARGTQLEQKHRAAMEQGIAGSFENFYPAPYHRWYTVEVRPSEDGIVVFYRDITVEKQAARKLSEQQALLAEIQQDARMATWVVDLETDALIFQRGAFPVFGRPNEELTTVSQWRSCVIEPDHDTVLRKIDSAIRSGKTVRHEWKMRTPDGGHVWVQSRYKAVVKEGVAVELRGITVDMTAEHDAREQLAAERTTLEHVQQTARVASWEHDIGADRVRYTSGSYPVYGRPFSEISDLAGFMDVVHPEDRERISLSTQAAMSSDRIMVNEFRATAPDGSTIWLEERFRSVREGGEAVSLRGMTIDISERKRNEEALRRSEERYRILSELNPQAMWMGSPQGDVTWANQHFLDYTGMTLDDLGRWPDAFDAEDRGSALAAWSHSVQTGENYEVEARMVRSADKSSRWWWVRAQPMRDADGKILNWLGVAMDIHDRRGFAQALLLKQEETERQRAELETVYATAPIGLALFDPVEFRYLRLNQRQAEFFGLEPSEILGQTVTDLAPIPGLLELFEQVREGTPVVNHLLEGELVTGPGHRYWTVNYFPVLDGEGKIQAISAASLEITPQKRAENALIQSEKLAAVGRLATSISHEINNPLEAITNLLYLIANSELTDDARLYLSMAQSELARVCQIATQTLRFHRQSVGPTNVSGKDLVAAVLNLYQGRLANSGIRVETLYASDQKILCFENDIRQVLNNLIANAIDAMRKGGRLVVRTHDSIDFAPGQSQPRYGIRITIADTGHGMPPEVMERIFEAFYTTKDLNGTGLGMWISEGIVKRHHGRLSVRSSVDDACHGTIFTLFLPAQDRVEAAT